MNREILFKAKRKDNGEWVEGYYIYHIKRTICPIGDSVKPEDEQHVIMRDGFSDWNMPRDTVVYEINPDTLCQYTGLTGKYGKKIWENDILRGYQYPYRSDGNDNYFAEVTWFENCPAFGIYTFKNPKSNVCGISEGNTEFMENWNSEDWEVIGNIFDNADLLEVE
ncbi:YopX family protein [Mediterraneibacter gnavus]|uniref:YopX family protein n=1 Tax=Mediterraneibacter gnavus TaxID=33038 RepID=UPI001FAA1D20|nr:YopX family protein [Mediterraneibacter gnavus]